jgi:hypothetical protein
LAGWGRTKALKSLVLVKKLMLIPHSGHFLIEEKSPFVQSDLSNGLKCRFSGRKLTKTTPKPSPIYIAEPTFLFRGRFDTPKH